MSCSPENDCCNDCKSDNSKLGAIMDIRIEPRGVQHVPCINGQPVVQPAGQWVCSNNPVNGIGNIDPIWYPPASDTAPPYHAPNGYQWQWNGGVWSLVPVYSSDVIYGNGGGHHVNTALTVSDLVNNNLPTPLASFFTQHKTLVYLALAAGAYYLLTEK